MEFPYHSNHPSFLNEEEQSWFAAFMTNEPIVRMQYTNQRGESRKVMRVFLPQGVVTEETAFTPPLPKEHGGGRRYHTPRSTQGLKEGRVLWSSEDKGGSCTGREWFKWLGKEFSQEMMEPVVKSRTDTATQLARIKGKKTVIDFEKATAEKKEMTKKGK